MNIKVDERKNNKICIKQRSKKKVGIYKYLIVILRILRYSLRHILKSSKRLVKKCIQNLKMIYFLNSIYELQQIHERHAND